MKVNTECLNIIIYFNIDTLLYCYLVIIKLSLTVCFVTVIQVGYVKSVENVYRFTQI